MPTPRESSPPSAKLSAGEASNWTLIRRMLAFGWRYRATCLQVLCQQAVLVMMTLCGLGITGLGIDFIRHSVDPTAAAPRWPFDMSPPSSWQPLTVVAVIAGTILLLALLQSTLRFHDAMVMGRLVQRIVVQLRSDVYDKLQRLSFRFFDANESGSIINRVAGDVQAMRVFVDGVVIEVIAVTLTLAIYLGYMLSIHVPLTLVSLATTPVLWMAAARFSRVVKPAYRYNRTLSDDMIRVLSENVQGVQVVKGFGRELEEIDKFAAANRRVCDHKKSIFWNISIFQPFMYFLTKFNLAVLLGYGGYLVIRGEIRLGEGLFVFANLLQQFSTQVEQITNITNSIQASLTGAQRVFEVLDAPEEIVNRTDAKRLGKSRGEVRFERVSFGYRETDQVLSEVNFTVQPGKCIAIVGATGAGKSTLLSLIPRFYDTTGGRVLLDGVDVRDIELQDLRRNVGLVFQESFLFSNTVAANIAFGHPEATREQIERAARIAAAHDFITELPHGYDTVIGEYGSNLSGGQRQRLAIARAILLEPSILILDDATAAVDPETEHEILEAMDSAMRGRTTFVVAHRLSTLRRADLVVVLERGRVVQTGTHQELMGVAGHYHHAAALQLADVESSHLLGLKSGDAA